MGLALLTLLVCPFSPACVNEVPQLIRVSARSAVVTPFRIFSDKPDQEIRHSFRNRVAEDRADVCDPCHKMT
jgi:hypothetical protein